MGIQYSVDWSQDFSDIAAQNAKPKCKNSVMKTCSRESTSRRVRNTDKQCYFTGSELENYPASDTVPLGKQPDLTVIPSLSSLNKELAHFGAKEFLRCSINAYTQF